MKLPHTSIRFAIPSLLLGLALLSVSCSSLRKIPENESLLIKNKVKVSPSPAVSKSDVNNLLIQEPNSRFLGIRLKLGIYNAAKVNKNNWWNNKLREIGEPPCIFDSLSIGQSQQRIIEYANSQGYFSPQIRSEVNRKKRNPRKVSVSYHLDLGKPYTLKDIDIVIHDDSLKRELSNWRNETSLHPGMQYSVNRLDQERSRITEQLQNLGYWAFAKDFISYTADSSLGTNQMNMIMHIRRPSANAVDTSSGDLQLLHHKKYYIDNVYIIPVSKSAISSGNNVFDTVVFEDVTRKEKRRGISGPRYHFLNQGTPIIKYKPIIQKNFIQPGDLYAVKNLNQTYDNLSDLRVFQYTNVTLTEKPYDTTRPYAENNLLDCEIRMIQGSRYGFSVEGQLTTSSGIQGIAANFTFQNRNTFGGGEILNIRVRGAYELQATIDQEKNRTFLNTFETRVEASLEFPRFLLPISLDRFSRFFRPTSNVSLSYSYQQKRDYSRGIFNAYFGYHWKQGRFEHTLNPIEVSTIQMIKTSSGFQATLDEYKATQNYRLYYQYSDHFILTPRYQFTYNDQSVGEVKDFNHLRLEVETAGNLLYGFSKAFNKVDQGMEGYKIAGLPFSQYVRAEADYRRHFVFGKKTDLVFRTALGIGYSYANSKSMPYEKGLFIGGNSTIRAWPLYQLGPGSYLHPEGSPSFERIGDVMMVFNLEQRFPIAGNLLGAVFLDAGNIWLIRPNEVYPNGEFRANRFYKELALGTGIGLRYDLKFFLLRVDVGIPLRDPALLDVGDVWKVKSLKWSDLLFNFGIGYPF